METELKLAVNDIPIKTDYFVKEFTEHTAIGMMGGLRDTGEVKELITVYRRGGGDHCHKWAVYSAQRVCYQDNHYYHGGPVEANERGILSYSKS